MIRRLLPLLLAFTSLLFACEPIYGDLAAPIDPSTVFRGAAETYMVGDSEMTAMVIFGEQDEENVGDIAYAEILANGETRLLTGQYRAPEEGVVAATFDILYFIPYEYDRGATERVGSQTMELDVPVEYTGMLASGEDEVTLETEDGSRTFTRLGRLLERIDLSTPEGELLLARLYNYATLVSVARVIGWGSAGLTMYIGRVGMFQGLQTGRQEVALRELLSPETSFTYIDYSDMTGIHFEGTYESHTDLSATGVMLGSVDFTMAPGSTAPPLFAGTVEYEALIVENGVPVDGWYRFIIEGDHTFDVVAADYHDIDLGGLFGLP